MGDFLAGAFALAALIFVAGLILNLAVPTMIVVLGVLYAPFHALGWLLKKIFKDW